jgi:phosphatidylserine/phosphatidylglycerophosphate/cardiolipin synthase-like enzyme
MARSGKYQQQAVGAPLRRRLRRAALALALFAWVAIGLWGVTRPLPPGAAVSTDFVATPLADIAFLTDTSYENGEQLPVREQSIFDEVFRIIDQAQHFVVLDFFLINDHRGHEGVVHRELSRELVEHLLARKRDRPDIDILLVTDPVNEVYGGEPLEDFARLRRAGIDVVTTRLTRLRDPNPAYSALWRIFVQWWGNSAEGGWLPNPFDAGPSKITLRSWLALLNFKANHRKVVVADRPDGNWVALVTSANPHDASSAHSNVALRFDGSLAARVLESEVNVARFSGWDRALDTGAEPAPATGPPETFAQVRFVTEGAIRSSLTDAIGRAGRNDTIRIATFYLSERQVIEALLAAARRGANVRVLLDPNKDAFGRVKDGIPNRPVAAELVRHSHGAIKVRWYRTHGEQFHTKLALVSLPGRLLANLGSANATRRNIDNYNLEANLDVDTMATTPLGLELVAYFDRLWNADPAVGPVLTDPFERWEDPSRLRYWRYRVMEATGLSTF